MKAGLVQMAIILIILGMITVFASGFVMSVLWQKSKILNAKGQAMENAATVKKLIQKRMMISVVALIVGAALLIIGVMQS